MDHLNRRALCDKLTGALIGLARATDGNEHLISEASTAVIVESLCATLDNGNLDNAGLEKLLQRVAQEKRNMVPDCFTCASPCGKNNDYDMENLWTAEEDIRSLKSRILSGIRDMAVCARQAAALGHRDETVDWFFYKALIVIGIEDFGPEDLRAIVMEMDDVHRRCMAILGNNESILRNNLT